MQITVSSQRQNKSVPTFGCFAYLLYARAEFLAICDSGNRPYPSGLTIATSWPAVTCIPIAVANRALSVKGFAKDHHKQTRFSAIFAHGY